MRLWKRWAAGTLVIAGCLAAGLTRAQDNSYDLEEISRGLAPALDEVCTDAVLRDEALYNPQFLLDLSGTGLPEEVLLETFELGNEMPFEPVGPTIELTHCRNYWVCEPDDENEPFPCTWTSHEVCLGIRVVDTGWPWGPVPWK